MSVLSLFSFRIMAKSEVVLVLWAFGACSVCEFCGCMYDGVYYAFAFGGNFVRGCLWSVTFVWVYTDWHVERSNGALVIKADIEMYNEPIGAVREFTCCG
jgi:hypothetical protein